MKIDQFMKLPDIEKEKYIQKTHPSEDPKEVLEYDFGVFENMKCEKCNNSKKHEQVFGTSDSREPKFCKKHFIEMSKETDFIKN